MSIGNDYTKICGLTDFYGGLSTDAKIGIENSYADGECLDVRKSPSQMSVLPMARKLNDEDVTGLMLAMTQSKDGNIWGVDEVGQLYKIDAQNDVSKIGTAVGGSGFGLEYSQIDDALWFTDNKHKLFSYGPVLNPAGLTQTISTDMELMDDESEYIVNAIKINTYNSQTTYVSNASVVRDSGTQTWAVKTAISETDADKALFLPAAVNVYSIGVKFAAKPSSGTVKLIIHDENNNVVAQSSEISATDVTAGSYCYFQVRPNPSNALSPSNQFCDYNPWTGNTIEAGTVFHIHVVASVSGFTTYCSEASDIYKSLAIKVKSTVLNETYNQKHPMTMYDKLYIGNGRYVSTKESSPRNLVTDTLFIQDALRLDDGYEVCSFGSSDEYLMIGAEKYSVNSTRGFQAGRIYFWDRDSENPNFYIDCPMGSPKCIFNFGNIVYIIIAGALYAYTGGKELVKARTLQGTDTEYSGSNSVTEVYPNMMTIRREILLIGFPSKTTAYTIRHGVHAWGSIDKNYPNCFTYNYKIPGETTSQTLSQYNSDLQSLRIGCVYNFNDTLFYSYEVGTRATASEAFTYRKRLAIVDNDSGTSTSFLWKSLQYDAGSPATEKMALRMGIYFDALPTNTTITPIYRIDDGDWQTCPYSATTGERYITCEIDKRFHEIQYGFNGTTGNDSLTPKIKQVSLEYRLLKEERRI